jgi:hypothetical protein
MVIYITANSLSSTPAGPSARRPLKILIYEDQSGAAWVGYNSPEYLGVRHHVPGDLLTNIGGVRALAGIAAGTNTAPLSPRHP